MGHRSFGGPGGPNFKVEPPFLVNVFLAWLVTSCHLVGQKRIFGTPLYMAYAAKTQECTIFYKLSLLEAFLTQKSLSVPKTTPWYVLGAVSSPNEFMRMNIAKFTTVCRRAVTGAPSQSP